MNEIEWLHKKFGGITGSSTEAEEIERPLKPEVPDDVVWIRELLSESIDKIDVGNYEAAGNLLREAEETTGCDACGKEYEVRMDNFLCPYCESKKFEILIGSDISIKEVEVE